MRYFKQYHHRLQRGYTIIELMIALVVSAIVIAGSMAGFNVIHKQYGVINVKLKVDRVALDWISQLQKDVAMAGFKDYNHAITMSSAEAFIWEESPLDEDPTNIIQSGFFITYDDLDMNDTIYRKGVRYYCKDESSRIGIAGLHKCRKYTGKCLTSPCTTWADEEKFMKASNASAYPRDEAEIDFVKEFSVKRMNLQTTGTAFLGVPQTLKFKLVLFGSDRRNLVSEPIERTYHWVVRAKNISLVKEF
jgi:prepilin-type N-terminal cleavage/methylation domain-containing protein